MSRRCRLKPSPSRITLITNPRQHTRMRVKESKLPLSNGVLVDALDAMKLPEGHLCCGKCSGYKFECWMYGYKRRIEMGCMQCSEATAILFPLDVNLEDYAKSSPNGIYGRHNGLGQGRFQCVKHPSKGMILIHNVDVISIGCEVCFTELNICLRKAKGITLVG